MPDNQKDSKIMSMLERSGIIRKADSGQANDADENPEIYDKDIKPIFDQSSNPVTIKTAPRQPVPGMPTPSYPAAEQAKEKTEVQPVPQTTIEQVYTQKTPEPSVSDAPVYEEAPEPVPEPEPYRDPQTPDPSFGGLNLFGNGSSAVDTSDMEAVLRESEPQPESYTDRYLNVNELYDALALRSKKTDTIYLIEEYLQTLPGSLPDSQRREIVSKLLSASGFDYDLLMGDGVLRVKMLKEYAERFARHTDDYIAARQAELDELNQQIMRTRRLIENRKELHKKQFYTIEAEAQRLKEILTFISG